MTHAKAHGTTISSVADTATLSTREIETGRVGVRTLVDETITDFVAELAREELLIERRQVVREVADAPQPYQEGAAVVRAGLLRSIGQKK